MRNSIVLLFCCFFGFTVNAQNTDKPPTKIEILHAESLSYDEDFGDFQTLTGDVRFKHNQVLMDCDSARFYEGTNKIEAFGHIFIRQPDTFRLYGDYLEYNGDTKKSVVKENVRLTDEDMTLTTDVLHYDMENKVGVYTTGGRIVDEENTLTSTYGSYHSRSKIFYFKDSVVLLNKEYVMHTDTMQYHNDSKICRFYGATTITSEDNTISCRKGFYNTATNKSRFWDRAVIYSTENQLFADSMVYDRDTGIGKAFGNLHLIDTVERMQMFGAEGVYNRNTKFTQITGSPLALKETETDTLFIKADTFVDINDSLQGRRLIAYPNSRLFKSDMQGKGDSLVYNMRDSVFRLFYDPVLWSDENQITGDTVYIFQKNNQADRLETCQNAFICSVDSAGFYNQIKGIDMTGYFKNNQLNNVRVKGNGQSIYYSRDEKGKYSGVNKINCSNMVIYLDSSQIDRIHFLNKPDANFYPLYDFPSKESRLSGFVWRAEERPNRKEFAAVSSEEEATALAPVFEFKESDEALEPNNE